MQKGRESQYDTRFITVYKMLTNIARSAYTTSEQSFCTYFYYGLTNVIQFLLQNIWKKINLISVKKCMQTKILNFIVCSSQYDMSSDGM